MKYRLPKFLLWFWPLATFAFPAHAQVGAPGYSTFTPRRPDSPARRAHLSDDVFAAAYDDTLLSFGVAVYEVRGGALRAVWRHSTRNDDLLGADDLEGPGGLSGSYHLARLAARDPSAGTLNISPNGSRYFVSWTLGAPAGITYHGRGTRQGNHFFVFWAVRPELDARGAVMPRLK